jgi:hypothetical protein
MDYDIQELLKALSSFMYNYLFVLLKEPFSHFCSYCEFSLIRRHRFPCLAIAIKFEISSLRPATRLDCSHYDIRVLQK